LDLSRTGAWADCRYIRLAVPIVRVNQYNEMLVRRSLIEIEFAASPSQSDHARHFSAIQAARPTDLFDPGADASGHPNPAGHRGWIEPAAVVLDAEEQPSRGVVEVGEHDDTLSPAVFGRVGERFGRRADDRLHLVGVEGRDVI
jgi:hypothetical protein